MSGTAARSTASGIGLPFQEAIAFFRQKVNEPTQHWTDVWQAAHSRSFMVAGAAADALLNDFRAEISRALEQGTTLRDFRLAFDDIVARHGWVHNGAPAWRSRIIYETNLSTAYAAGRYAQQTQPDTLALYPYWQYVHSGARHPRQQHLAWNGLTLRADDAFWRTHYPPNGWRCGCRVRILSARDLARQGKSGPDASPRIETRPWTNPRTGEEHQVPVGIDPGFDYNPGEAWRGRPQIPGDAVPRPPPGNWPPPVPGGSSAPVRRPATRPAPAIDRDVVPVRPVEPGRPDIPLPPARPLAARPVVRRDPATPAVRAADEALREGYAAWGASLSAEELEALRLYRRVGQALNDIVVGAEAGSPGLRQAIAALRGALSRAAAPRSITVQRGASAAEVKALGRVGTESHFRAFTSTSLDPDIARDFARRHGGRTIEIRIAPGTRGIAYVHPWPVGRPAQYEVLLAPGTRYRVLSRTSRRIVLEITDVGHQGSGG
ncbi:hypothetical protein GXW74_15615 [Roseomonas eburnea]|uniref:Phage head morphogenesis domain-containing protein n=1 Tax=Neoroseomonas eburnea TaxID=1346889 RepID=A0A9X9XDY6_9PROT|nr:phage minor head protein [Neoroseomonas eburnea]MBR0681922.1 hypothetical protein [Neoroseomonas eburnea]